MLTGDKGETAEEIGYNCGMFQRDNFKVFKVEEAENLDIICSKVTENSGIMVPGDLIPRILERPTEISNFVQMMQKSKAVIIFRSSPSQKADIVKLVRRKIKDSVTLAIGDGANDVNMIQEAHVGIGLYGKEGN
mmetsp:Transcript_38821/g.37165  ORF Transcript_38821/g.37165 Transcript_38821/m.37165 type:complete len:134 (-) Transcript_38821:866-1267(-)|eukprot:CAMPEP_0170566538 /NCGR_PEP_ID=MMETSP0211-20121228/79905_1 /TAXON_ID=311385 /ORGANISM="Pseudokeronopsis sp., Strain OXSARD2" /LENGTH=133 /DNA_ID=CAMNT_0010887745 /DNA_START=428 /DNA_END=829 /DNA_ORIENTATION=-